MTINRDAEIKREAEVQEAAAWKATQMPLSDVGRYGKLAENDPVNHPAHYTDGRIEVIEFIEDKKLGYHLGNAVKYICRAGKKDPTKEIEDLQKADWYVKRRIEQLQKRGRWG